MPKQVKRRYLCLEISTRNRLNEREVTQAVWTAVITLFGEYCVSHADLYFIDYNSRRNCLIIRCAHKSVDKLRASIATINEINGTPSAIRVVGVSGTLHALRKKCGC